MDDLEEPTKLDDRRSGDAVRRVGRRLTGRLTGSRLRSSCPSETMIKVVTLATLLAILLFRRAALNQFAFETARSAPREIGRAPGGAKRGPLSLHPCKSRKLACRCLSHSGHVMIPVPSQASSMCPSNQPCANVRPCSMVTTFTVSTFGRVMVMIAPLFTPRENASLR
jgi:hypothetical protein